MLSNECWLKGDNIFLSFPSFSWSSPGCSCLSLWFRFSLLFIRTQLLSPELLLSQCISLQRVIPLKEQDFAFVLVEFDKVLVNLILPFSVGPPVRQLCSHWLAPSVSHHLQTWWECHLLLLVMMSSRRSHRTDLCSTALVSGLQPEYHPLITALCAQSSKQLFYRFIIHSSILQYLGLGSGILWKTVSKTLLKMR